MSRNGVLIAVLALIVGVGALVLQFALPSETGGDVTADLQALRGEVELLSQQPAPGFRIAYVNAETAFSVFTDQVSDLRQDIIDSQTEILQLQQEYVAGTLSQDDYEKQYNELQAELLDAQITVDINTINKMIAAEGFSDIHSDLQRLREEAQPIVDEMKNLLSTARIGVIDALEFQNRYAQIQNAFSQLDALLTQAASAKIVQATERVAIDKGYDLVVRVKNVIMYRNAASVTDITDLVKARLNALY